MFVADFGNYGTESDERGVFKTHGRRQDAGRKCSFRDEKTGAVDVAIDRKNPNVMFAALWEAYRVEYQMSSGGPGSGLFKSTDGGETWKEITRTGGLPQGLYGKMCVAISGADSQSRLRADRKRQGRPLQLGRCRRDLEAGERGAQCPSARLLLHARLRRSEQQGRRLHAEHERVPLDRRRQDADQHRQRHARRSPRPLDRSGRLEARDGRPTTAAARVATTSPRRSALDGPGFSDRAVLPRDHDQARAVSRLRRAAGQLHAVRAERDAFGRGGGGGGRGNVVPCYQVGGGEPGYIAPDPKDPNVFFAGANNGSFLTRFNRRTGELKEVGAYPRFFSGENSAQVNERWQWTYPIIFSPVDPERPLHLVAARVEDDRRRPDVDRDQRRPHASRSEDDAGFGRADHARHEQPGDLRHGLLAGARARPTSTSSGRDRTTASSS